MANDTITLTITGTCVGCDRRYEAHKTFIESQPDNNSRQITGLDFEHEPDNPVDPNAVAVLFVQGRKRHHLGYVKKEETLKFRKFLKMRDTLSNVSELFWLLEHKMIPPTEEDTDRVLKWFTFKVETLGEDTE